jgi:hypothetical protein
MSASQHDLTHLAALVEAANAHAVRLGPEVGPVCRLLDEALATLREVQANGGRADEGLRPQDLSSDNDA